MKMKINQQDEELSEKNVRIEQLQHQLQLHQKLPNTNKTSVGSQTEKVGIYSMDNSFVVVV